MKKLETNESYHSNPAIGSTLLKNISKKSMLHALTEEKETSDAMELGKALHAAILEPETFASSVYVIPSNAPKKPTSAQLKAKKPSEDAMVSILFWKKIEVETKGMIVITSEQMKQVEGMVAALKGHSRVPGMLTGGESEYSYYTQDEETGLMLKCRPDISNAGALIDLKTSFDASINGFTQACINQRYHVQAAYYLDVFNKANGTNYDAFYFIAVEPEAPHGVGVFQMDEAAIALGRSIYRKALNQYASYMQNPTRENLNKYGYEQAIQMIIYQAWVHDKQGV